MKTLIIAIVFLTSGICKAQEISGRVVHVHDGDSFTIMGCDSIRHKVRLWGVDAPELKQPGGEQVRDLVVACIQGKMIKLDVTGHEKYGRLLAITHIQEGPYKGIELNELLVNSGYAWAYFPTISKRHPQKVAEYQNMQQVAQRDKKGIWQNADNTPPWQYRKNKK